MYFILISINSKNVIYEIQNKITTFYTLFIIYIMYLLFKNLHIINFDIYSMFIFFYI